MPSDSPAGRAHASGRGEGAQPAAPLADAPREMFSARVLTLMDDILAGRAPNAGRFCGNCYHPLAPERTACPHCGFAVEFCAAVVNIPREIIALHRKRRWREGLVVRSLAWCGLGVGLGVALVPIALAGTKLWAVGAFFGLLAFFWIFSANLANTVGDALGYHWGQAAVNRGWREFARRRDGD